MRHRRQRWPGRHRRWAPGRRWSCGRGRRLCQLSGELPGRRRHWRRAFPRRGWDCEGASGGWRPHRHFRAVHPRAVVRECQQGIVVQAEEGVVVQHHGRHRGCRRRRCCRRWWLDRRWLNRRPLVRRRRPGTRRWLVRLHRRAGAAARWLLLHRPVIKASIDLLVPVPGEPRYIHVNRSSACARVR